MSLIQDLSRRLSRAATLAAATIALCVALPSFSSAAFISIAKDLTIAPGETLTVPVTVTNDSSQAIDILNIDIYIAFDNTLITVSNLTKGPFTSSFNAALVIDSALGQINTTQDTAVAASLAANSSAVVLSFDVVALASFSTPGLSTALNIMARQNGVSTNINEGGITLNPAPTNNPDDAVDGLITVRGGGGGVIPEPSSIALVGLGLAGLGGFALRRRRSA